MRAFIPRPSDDGPCFDSRGPVPAHALAIKQWAREILRLDDDAVITVSELACADPGCPLVETVIAVFDAQGSRRWKLHHARAAVTKLNLHFALRAPAPVAPSTPPGPPAPPPPPDPLR